MFTSGVAMSEGVRAAGTREHMSMREWHSLHGERPREAIDVVSSPLSAIVANPRPATVFRPS